MEVKITRISSYFNHLTNWWKLIKLWFPNLISHHWTQVMPLNYIANSKRSCDSIWTEDGLEFNESQGVHFTRYALALFPLRMFDHLKLLSAALSSKKILINLKSKHSIYSNTLYFVDMFIMSYSNKSFRDKTKKMPLTSWGGLQSKHMCKIMSNELVLYNWK